MSHKIKYGGNSKLPLPEQGHHLQVQNKRGLVLCPRIQSLWLPLRSHQCSAQGWHWRRTQQCKHQIPLQNKIGFNKLAVWNPVNLPSNLFFTVHTAFGLPGSSDTAISDTSNPWRKTLSEDLGPRPQSMYNWEVSSFAKVFNVSQ